MVAGFICFLSSGGGRGGSDSGCGGGGGGVGVVASGARCCVIFGIVLVGAGKTPANVNAFNIL